VVLQRDPGGLRVVADRPGHLVGAPENGQWICGWNGDALTGFVVDVTETMSTRCHLNTSWHIVSI
jgi:hypothetical protein